MHRLKKMKDSMLHAYADEKLNQAKEARPPAWTMYHHECSGVLKIARNGSRLIENARMYFYAQVITEDGSANGVWEKVVEAQKQSRQKLSQPATLDLMVSELQSQVSNSAMQSLAEAQTLEGMSGINR